MSDIFISYTRTDEGFVSQLVSDLERRAWDVFYDRKLKPGQNFEQLLPKEAEQARYFLVVLSPDSLNAPGVQRELAAALRREREGRTTVVPLLFRPSDPQRVKELLGPNLYANFTADYKVGLEELLSALTKTGNPVGSDTEDIVNRGKKRILLSKETGIGAAVIAAIATLVTGYWQFVYKPAHSDQNGAIQYMGRVIDSGTQQVILRAKVSVDTQGPPQVYYSDSDGVFYLKLPAESGSARIRVEANGYEPFDRNVSVSRTGIEDVRLTPKPSPSPTKAPPRPRPRGVLF